MFCSWQQTHKNLWCNLQHLCCHCPRCWLSCGMKTITCVSFNHVQFLLLTNRHCVHQRWHLHLGWCYHCRPNASGFTSLILCNSRIWCFQCGSSQKNELSWSSPHWSIRPFNNWSIWMFTKISRCVLTWLCQCHLELEMAKGLSSFCFGYFFSSKNFNHIAKIASIFHLKSSSSCKPISYFSTSTLLGHTSHHHGWPIVGDQFLTWNISGLLHGVDFWHGKILTFSLN